MSKLKVYPAFSVYNRAATPEESLVYLKSEADKVIDFWKKESHDHYERWFNLNKQYEGWFGKVMRCERAERELRNQKYKRCLDKAEIASHNWHLHNSFYLMGHKDYELKKCERYERHRLRWLELAEKFKEAK